MTRAIYRNLRDELEAIASVELCDALANWGEWTDDGEKRKLLDYLEAEMREYGMLSVEHARDGGESLAAERREARRVIARLRRELGVD